VDKDHPPGGARVRGNAPGRIADLRSTAGSRRRRTTDEPSRVLGSSQPAAEPAPDTPADPGGVRVFEARQRPSSLQQRSWVAVLPRDGHCCRWCSATGVELRAAHGPIPLRGYAQADHAEPGAAHRAWGESDRCLDERRRELLCPCPARLPPSGVGAPVFRIKRERSRSMAAWSGSLVAYAPPGFRPTSWLRATRRLARASGHLSVVDDETAPDRPRQRSRPGDFAARRRRGEWSRGRGPGASGSALRPAPLTGVGGWWDGRLTGEPPSVRGGSAGARVAQPRAQRPSGRHAEGDCVLPLATPAV
jgi:hypothetical protein